MSVFTARAARFPFTKPLGVASLALLLGAVALLAMTRPGIAANDWAPETATLSNGMEVVVLPDHRMPVVTHMVWYRVGAADEPPGQSGIAHFLEHLMFKGTEKIPVGEFSRIVARNGGQDNAFTSFDYTAYFQRVAVDRLALVMEMEADRMRNLRLNDEIVLPERDVILEERSMRTDNDPAALLSEQVSAALFLNHPYGIPIIGWLHEMETLDREGALDFYERFYNPSNAILIVAGDVTLDDVMPLARRFYGRLPAGEVMKRDRVDEPPQIAPRRVELTDARARQAQFERRYLVPSYATAAPGEAEALEILTELLGGGPTSHLYRKLVVEEGIAASAGAWYWGDALDDTRFSVYATPRPGVTVEQVEAGVDRVMKEVISKLITPSEVERVQRRLIANQVYARDSQYTMARIFGVALTSGQTIEDVLEWPDRIAALSAEDVIAVAERVLVPARSVTGILRPAEEGGV